MYFLFQWTPFGIAQGEWKFLYQGGYNDCLDVQRRILKMHDNPMTSKEKPGTILKMVKEVHSIAF